MFGVAETGDMVERRAVRRLSTWNRDYLREVALADLACGVVGVFIAAQLRFGSNVTSMYLALSLALPVLWVAALWLAGAYDVRFIGTGSDEFRKVLNAGIGLTAAVTIFSYAINLELSRAYVVIALPSLTVFDMLARFALRKRLVRRRMHGKSMHSVVAVGHGFIRNKLSAVRDDPVLTRYAKKDLLVSWAEVDREHQVGVENYLTAMLKPLHGEPHPHSVQTLVNLPPW